MLLGRQRTSLLVFKTVENLIILPNHQGIGILKKMSIFQIWLKRFYSMQCKSVYSTLCRRDEFSPVKSHSMVYIGSPSPYTWRFKYQQCQFRFYSSKVTHLSNKQFVLLQSSEWWQKWKSCPHLMVRKTLALNTVCTAIMRAWIKLSGLKYYLSLRHNNHPAKKIILSAPYWVMKVKGWKIPFPTLN